MIFSLLNFNTIIMKLKKLLLPSLLSLLGYCAHAQKGRTFQEEMAQPYPDYRKAVKLMEKQVEEKDPDLSPSDVKHFKRAYFFAKDRLDSEGTLKSYADLFRPDGVSTISNRVKCTDDIADWQYVGPDQILQFSSGNPNGRIYGMGRVDAVDVHPTDANTILCGSAAGGIWKTTNGGQQWVNVTDNLQIPFLGILSIARDPFNVQHLLAATGYPPPGGYFGSSGILQSFDGGDSWSRVNFPDVSFAAAEPALYDMPVLDIAFDDQVQGVVYALQERNRVYRSTNGGASWGERWGNQHNSNGVLPYFGSGITLRRLEIARDVNNNLSLLVAGFMQYTSTGYNSVYRFDGTTWTAIPLNSPNAVDGTRFAVSPNTPQLVYMLEIGAVKTLKKSTDGGLTFTTLGTVTGAHGTSSTEMAVSHFDDNKIFMLGLYSSNFKIYDVTTLSYTEPTFKHHADNRTHFMWKGNNREILFNGHDGGVSKYEEGVGGSDLPWNGLHIGQYYGFDTPEFDATTIIGGLQDNGTTKYDGTVWKHISGGDGGHVQISKFDPIDFWVNANNATKYWRNNAHTISDRVTSPKGYFDVLGNEIKESPSQQDLLYMGYALNNGPKTPFLAKADFGVAPPLVQQISPLLKSQPSVIEAVSDQYILFATRQDEDDATQAEKGLFKTINGGQTWTNITPHFNNGVTMQSSYETGSISDIEVDGTGNPSTIYAAYGGMNVIRAHKAVIRSTDGGQTWENYSQGLPDVPVTALEIQKGSPKRIFAGTDLGVYYRDQNMTQWECFSKGLPPIPITELKINYCAGKLRASTYGRGIYETDIEISKQASVSVNGTQVWNTDKWFHGNINVNAGAELTINNATITMGANTRIQVAPGGKLNLNNTTITSGCGEFWDGIFVHGTANQYGGTTQSWNIAPYVPQSGWLNMNNSTIQYAKNAVRLWNPFNWKKVGGVIQAKNSVFKNNKRAIEFMAYENHLFNSGATNHPIENNLSYFEKCEFVYDNADVDAGQSFVTLWKVRGVEFKGCTFEDKVSTQPRTLGIFGLNAGIRLKNIEDPFSGITTVNQFKNLESGVVVAAESPTMRDVILNEAEFTGCKFPITIDGMDNVMVTKNVIRAGEKWDTEIGIRLLSCTGYQVEANNITKPNAQSKNIRIGIGAAYNGGDPNKLYRNTITQAQWGILGFGANFDQAYDDWGLTFRCNGLTTQNMDVAALGNQPNDGFARIVGTIANNKLAANTFTPNPVAGSASQLFNWATNNMIYTTRNNSATQVYEPTEVLTNKVSVILGSPDAQTCKNELRLRPATASTGDLQQVKNVFQQGQEAYYNARSAHYNLVDGGNTPLALQSIQQAGTADQWKLRTSLLADSPLSTDVLNELITQNSLPNALLFEVLMANPHIARNGDLMAKLEEKTPAMPAYMLNALKGKVDERTLKVELEEKISAYYRQARQSQLNVISYYQQDTLAPADSLLAWQQKWSNYEEKRWLAANTYDKGDYTLAKTQYAQIGDQLALSQLETEEYQAVLNYLNQHHTIMTGVNETGFQNPDAQADNLKPFLTTENRAKRYARNMRFLLQNQLYEQEPVQVPTTQAGKRAFAVKEQPVKTVSPAVFKLYPNPASNYISLEWDNKELGDGKKELLLYDAQGRLVKQVVLPQGPMLQLELDALKPGQYTYSLLLEGITYTSGSLNIIR